MEVRRSLVVNATPLETRIALLENGQLCELFIERSTQASQDRVESDDEKTNEGPSASGRSCSRRDAQ